MQDLPFQTLTQFAALGLTLVAGWFLGLASASGGRKWRERFYDEEINNAGYRDRAESDLRDAARRIRDLEAENAKLRAGAPVAEPAHEDHGHSTAALAGAAIAGAAAGAVATHAVHEHHDAPAEPVAAAHAEPAHAEPVHAEPAHAEVAHAEPAPAAPDTHADAHHAPADAHHH
jgi:hypothetical protein